MTKTKEELMKEYREHVDKAVKKFREEIKVPEGEKITEEYLNKKDYKIKEIAIKKSIPSRELKEAILNS